MLDLDRAIASPQDHFDTPRDLLDEPELTHEQKVSALRNWQHDVRELSVATDENMPGGDDREQVLEAIDHALRRLDVDPAEAPTRHGG
jgi:hypothetical protein